MGITLKIIDWFKNQFKKDEYEFSIYDTPYIKKNHRITLRKNPDILIDDFRSSGESKEHWEKRVRLSKLKKERLEKLNKINDSIN